MLELFVTAISLSILTNTHGLGRESYSLLGYHISPNSLKKKTHLMYLIESRKQTLVILEMMKPKYLSSLVLALLQPHSASKDQVGGIILGKWKVE